MKTASYFTYTGPGRIGITVGNPRRAPAGFRIYRRLAPTRAMLALGYDAYRPRFDNDILAPLDPQAEWAALEALAAPYEPVLLCFERPPFTRANFCHRRFVAAWFTQHLGVAVPEIAADGTPIPDEFSP